MKKFRREAKEGTLEDFNDKRNHNFWYKPEYVKNNTIEKPTFRDESKIYDRLKAKMDKNPALSDFDPSTIKDL